MDKLRELGRKDALFFHKAGLIFGTITGILMGLAISDQADRYEIGSMEIKDGPKED